jgi:MFS family permease
VTTSHREVGRLPARFRRLLIAWSASLTADGMRFAAVPLLALATNPTAAGVSAVAAAMSLPWLLVALPAGALIDRIDPARVIAAANLARALSSVVLVVAIMVGSVTIPLLCIVGFALTAAETFADTAAQSLLVRIVPSGQLERANARFVSSENVALDLVGPLAAGGLFVLAQWLPFALSAVMFAGTAAAMVTLTGHRAESEAASRNLAGAESGDATERRPGRSLAEGFRIIFGDRVLRTLVITVAVMVAALGAMEAVLVLYSANTLRLSPALYPTLLACYSVGLLISTGLVGRLTKRFRSGPLMMIALSGIGATLIILGLVQNLIVAWLSFAVMGASGGVWNVLSATLRQRRTPLRTLARVSSTFRALTWGALPVGATLGGIGGENSSVGTVFVVAGAGVLLMGCIVTRSFLRTSSSAAGGAHEDGAPTQERVLPETLSAILPATLRETSLNTGFDSHQPSPVADESDSVR